MKIDVTSSEMPWVGGVVAWNGETTTFVSVAP
jgi:hypothetical protein